MTLTTSKYLHKSAQINPEEIKCFEIFYKSRSFGTVLAGDKKEAIMVFKTMNLAYAALEIRAELWW